MDDFTPNEQALLKGYARLIREVAKGVRRRTINADLTNIQRECSAYLRQLEWLTADSHGRFAPIRRIIDKKTPGRILIIQKWRTELEKDLSRGFTCEGNLLVPARSIAIDISNLAEEIDDLLEGKNIPVAFPKPYGLWEAAIIVDGWTEQSGVAEHFRTVAEILGNTSKLWQQKHGPGVHDPGFLADPILSLPPEAVIPESLLLAGRYAQLAIIHDMCLLAPSTTLITDRLHNDLGKWIDLSWENLKECERNCDPRVGSKIEEAIEKVESDLLNFA
ncbi:MAG: hypothetical protein NTZ17_11645 [Phycisphaerae bacterium]|nr:hypothetical protein [Phycisphaerae bacterium]